MVKKLVFDKTNFSFFGKRQSNEKKTVHFFASKQQQNAFWIRRWIKRFLVVKVK